jgi:hypothetical protein
MKKTDILNKYSSLVDNLVLLINEIGNDELNYRPIRNDGWSINEHLMHLANCETQSLLRVMMMKSEIKQENIVYDNKIWIKSISVDKINRIYTTGLLNNIKGLIIEIAANTNDQDFENDTISCLYNGEKVQVSLQENIESSIEHLEFHQKYIDKNLLEYKEKKS